MATATPKAPGPWRRSHSPPRTDLAKQKIVTRISSRWGPAFSSLHDTQFHAEIQSGAPSCTRLCAPANQRGDFAADSSERLKKCCRQFGARIFELWQGFGEGAGLENPVTEPKRSQSSKRPLSLTGLPNGYNIFENALEQNCSLIVSSARGIWEMVKQGKVGRRRQGWKQVKSSRESHQIKPESGLLGPFRT